jgi:hypothetical protein
MKAAILGNGPSRVSYTPNIKYDFVMGCNIPWTHVDATVIMDKDVILHMSQHPEKIIKMYVERNAWRYTDEIKKRPLFLDYLIKIVDRDNWNVSSAHMAAKVLIDNGYTVLDIYGCDSQFKISTESYTHQFVNSANEDIETSTIKWRKRWTLMRQSSPEVKFNFIE